MSSSLMNQARKRQEDKKRREKDPADLSGVQEPVWDSPDQDEKLPDAGNSTGGNDSTSAGDTAGVSTSSTDGEKTSDSAGGSASASAFANAGESAGERSEGQSPADASSPEVAPSPAGGARRARRRGRPRGPERVPLSVRILPRNDRRLTAAVEQTGLNPQTLVDQALDAYFKRLKIQDPEDTDQKSGAA